LEVIEIKKTLVFLFVAVFCFASIIPAFSADELIYETFDNWTNPNVAEGWKTNSVGGWGGEFNQIYEAAQEMTTGPGDTTYFRSIYKDFEVEPDKEYSISYEYKNWNTPKVWLQFYNEQNQLLLSVTSPVSTVLQNSIIVFTKQYIPNKMVRYVSEDTLVQNAVKAPSGAKRMRLVFQAFPDSIVQGSILQIKNVVLHEASNPTFVDQWTGTQYTYQKIQGPFINRNTEFSGGINNQVGTFTLGNLAGEYNIKPIAGSSQGISCAGDTETNYKMIYKDVTVTPQTKYRLNVDVVSNSSNLFDTTMRPSPVRIWVQYDTARGNILATHGIGGDEAAIRSDVWTTVTVPGPNKEPYTIAPSGADHARIILQVMGGTGGGTIFDNVSFTRYEN
jgi:hypothetical protein